MALNALYQNEHRYTLKEHWQQIALLSNVRTGVA